MQFFRAFRRQYWRFLLALDTLVIRTGRSMADGVSLLRAITKFTKYCIVDKRTPSPREKVLGADTTGLAVARVGTLVYRVSKPSFACFAFYIWILFYSSLLQTHP